MSVSFLVHFWFTFGNRTLLLVIICELQSRRLQMPFDNATVFQISLFCLIMIFVLLSIIDELEQFTGVEHKI